MEHTAHSGKFLHDGKTVSVRLAVMKNDRHIQLLRERELIAQHPLLKLSRRVLFPVVVQPDLADGNDLRLPRPRAERVQTVLRVGRAVLGMPADGGVDVRIGPRQLHRTAGGLRIAAGVEDQPHAVFGHGGEQRLTVGIERLVVVMRVGVKNQAHRVSFLFDRGDDPQQKGISQTAYSLAVEKSFAGSLTAWQQRLSGTRSTSNRLRENDFIRLLK